MGSSLSGCRARFQDPRGCFSALVTRPSSPPTPTHRVAPKCAFPPRVADSVDLRPAGTEGPAVFGPRGCRSKSPQPAWPQTTNLFSRGLRTCSPGAAGSPTWRLPASLSHAPPCCPPRLSDVSLGSLLPCAPATPPCESGSAFPVPASLLRGSGPPQPVPPPFTNRICKDRFSQ